MATLSVHPEQGNSKSFDTAKAYAKGIHILSLNVRSTYDKTFLLVIVDNRADR